MEDPVDIESPISDLLGELLFKYEWFLHLIGPDPTLDDVLNVGLKLAVIRHNDYRFCVYPNDHPPPHFHVLARGESAAFLIANGRRVKGHGGLKGRDKIIKTVWNLGKHDIAMTWNKSRPTDRPHEKFILTEEWGPHPTEEQITDKLRALRMSACKQRGQ